MLYIPFQNYPEGIVGGVVTFMTNLKDFLDIHQFSYTKNPDYARAIFFPVSTDIEIIKKIKFRKGKVIQRLDGVYYPSQHGEMYNELNNSFEDIYRNFADCVIFQSHYSKQQCFNMFGTIPENKHKIIYNGAIKKIYFPSPIINPIDDKIQFITTGWFRKKAMIEPIVKALDLIEKKYDFNLNIFGSITNDDILPLLNKKYIKFFGTKPPNEVANAMRYSHFHIHSQLNDNCPNSVIEAISCGLPIIGFNSGSMSELCYFSKELLASVSNEIFQKYEDFHPELLAEKIVRAIENYCYFKKNAIEHSHLYSFEECGMNYVTVFNEMLDSSFFLNYFNIYYNKFKNLFTNLSNV